MKAYDFEEEFLDSILNPFHRPDLWKQLREGTVKSPEEYFEKLEKQQLANERLLNYSPKHK